MTSLIAWVGTDDKARQVKRPSSLYLASDSRLTLTSGGSWDSARKLFASTRTADIFGYSGNDIFPALALGHVETLLNRGVLVGDLEDLEHRHEAIVDVVKTLFAADYPLRDRSEFTILHAGRQSSGSDSQFRLWELIRRDGNWIEPAEAILPQESGLVLPPIGSGGPAVEAWIEEFLAQDEGRRTSRAMFRAFCEALNAGGDDFCGGAPQLAGLWRIKPAGVFGVIHGGARFVGGFEIPDSQFVSEVVWFDHLFNQCDGRTLRPLKG